MVLLAVLEKVGSIVGKTIHRKHNNLSGCTISIPQRLQSMYFF
jgi:hypothetical protein